MNPLKAHSDTIKPADRLCTICARGGSKGLPGKNTRLLAGLPLLAHSIIQAQECGLFGTIAVSSDSEEILQIAQRFGATNIIVRPAALASDAAGKIPAILHAIQEVEESAGRKFQTLVDLDATSPLRLPKDIKGAVTLLENQNLSSVITGSPARRSPYFNLVEEQADGTVRLAKELPDGKILRRQDSPPCFDMNASIYVWNRAVFTKHPAVFYPDTKIYQMPEDRSIDIDSPLDFEIVSLILSQRD